MVSSYPANFSLRVSPFGCESPFPIPLAALLIYHLNYMYYLEPFFFSPEVGTRERIFGSVRLEKAAENMAILVGTLQKVARIARRICKQP